MNYLFVLRDINSNYSIQIYRFTVIIIITIINRESIRL